MATIGDKVKIAANMLLRKLGYQITRYLPGSEAGVPRDVEQSDIDVWKVVHSYTMTSPERVYSLCSSVEYVVRGRIPGDLVECGVWKGGSAMAMALVLARLGDTSRRLFLYDTYEEGWPLATEADVTVRGDTQQRLYDGAMKRGETHDMLWAKLDAVRDAMRSTRYPEDRIRFVRGKVEDTIPAEAPERIALLRLDTDFYDSTRHELIHLYPRLVSGGVLILDDYGLWKGCRKAADEYFAAHDVSILLHRCDGSTGYRIGVKR